MNFFSRRVLILEVHSKMLILKIFGTTHQFEIEAKVAYSEGRVVAVGSVVDNLGAYIKGGISVVDALHHGRLIFHDLKALKAVCVSVRDLFLMHFRFWVKPVVLVHIPRLSGAPLARVEESTIREAIGFMGVSPASVVSVTSEELSSRCIEALHVDVSTECTLARLRQISWREFVPLRTSRFFIKRIKEVLGNGRERFRSLP